MKVPWQAASLAVLLCPSPTLGDDLNADDPNAVKKSAATIVKNLLGYYTGNNPGDVPGNLPDPYYWWEAGGMFGLMVDYWFYTGDSQYNDITLQAISHQAGENDDFQPRNQTQSEGNDDQGFWALTAMNAAEQKFVNPPSDQPQYTALVQAVFERYVSRWDTDNCGGGLRWQILSVSQGYDYKNTVANGCFMNIAARLGRYLGDSKYTDWANKIWDWEESMGLIGDSWEIFDGKHISPDNNTCIDLDPTQWSYNAGLHMQAAAVMYNITGSDEWKQRVDGILNHTTTFFFQNGIMHEVQCEGNDNCDPDEQSFKGYLARFMRSTAAVAPHTADTILKVLKGNAPAAASVCTGSESTFRGTQGQACGFSWLKPGVFDGMVGVGEQMNAAGALIYTLGDVPEPATVNDGGTSKGDPNAGQTKSGNASEKWGPITTASKAGAGILTTLVLAGFMAFCAFLIYD